MAKPSTRRSLTRSFLLATFLCAISTFISKADDTEVQLATGGLVFVKNPSVEMVSEDLFISTEQIRILYRYANKSDKEVTIYVAFPLPDLKLDLVHGVTAIPANDPVNFVGFVTRVDGLQVHSNVEQRIFARDRD